MLDEQYALMHIFFVKLPGCALIGACTLSRTNAVISVSADIIMTSKHSISKYADATAEGSVDKNPAQVQEKVSNIFVCR